MKEMYLRVGDVLGDRFVIEGVVARGGMGLVYRAHDRSRQRPAAIKVLRRDEEEGDEVSARFAQEMDILAELRHPGIVAYESHGRAAEGTPFLAMEWLEGEDLASRIERRRLDATECLLLLRGVATALAVAHGRGVVHRDLKPSNVFLRDGEIGGVTLLDFGVARWSRGSAVRTRTGQILGTPEYMAPEQASGRREVGPSCDIFALGCVVFACFTGRSPFAAEQALVSLGRILFEDAPLLEDFAPGAPRALGELVARMLAKDPSRRPPDAAALLRELDAVASRATSDAAPRPRSLLSASVVQLVHVVVAIPRAGPSATAITLSFLDDPGEDGIDDELRELVGRGGAEIERLPDGTLIATLAHADGLAAPDRALQAARCALVLCDRLPEARVVVTTERGVLGAHPPVGAALERAGRLLEGASPASSAHVWLDDLTAGLLDARCHIRPIGGELFVLDAERSEFDESRPLLGRPTPCVGRELELSILALSLDRSIAAPEAQAVIITAAPGIGKSRVRHEFMRRLGAQAVEVLFARGDPMTAGAPYGLLGQALRRLAGVVDGGEPELQRTRLRERVARHLDPAEGRRVAELLGELCNVPFPDDESEKLRAARRDPRVLGEHVARAFVAFLRAECAARPVLLVLEDLHWGDVRTVTLIDAALRDLADRPFMVLGIARPEIDELFPKLWRERKIQDIRLSGLSRKAAQKLVAEALGDRATASVTERAVEQAGGNALYLEELIRAVAAGKVGEVPDSVLAMVQARLMRLDPCARRVLSAGSVFGETFWSGGVAALLGLDAVAVEAGLSALLGAELVERSAESRFPDDAEYRVRHSLAREAAYGLLTDADRSAAHYLAGAHLERMSERDPMTLAEHYRLGEAPERAVVFYARAAQQALDGSDLAATRARVERGIACGARGEALGVLLTIKAWALGWCGDFGTSYLAAVEALPLLTPGSVPWCRGMGVLAGCVAMLGQLDRLAALTLEICVTDPAPGARAAYVEVASVTMVMLGFAGFRELGGEVLLRMGQVAAQIHRPDPGILAWMSYHALYVRLTQPDPWEAFRLAGEASTAFEQVGDLKMSAMAQVDVGIGCASMGDLAEAEAVLRDAIATGRKQGEPYLIGYGTVHLSLLLAERGGPTRADEAQQLATWILEQEGFSGTWVAEAARCSLAAIHLARGEPSLAEVEARRALEALRIAPALRPRAYTALIRSLLDQLRFPEACAVAEEGLALVASLGGAGESEVGLRVAAAETFAAAGERAAARVALTDAVAQLRLRASRIPDDAFRCSFLAEVPENARALALARDWAGER